MACCSRRPGWIEPNVKAALISTSIYGLAILGFAITRSYLLAVILLLVAGVANLASMSIGQTIVQLEAPPAERGRVLGVYAMSASGLRAGSGFTVGLLGAAVGLHWSLGLSAVALCVGTALAAVYALRDQARPGAGSPSMTWVRRIRTIVLTALAINMTMINNQKMITGQ